MTNPWDQHRDQNTGKYIIAYTIDRGFNTGQISPILAAIKTIEDVSCIKFELLTQQKVPHPQSIFFSKSNEYKCSSSVGWHAVPAKHSIHLHPICLRKHVVLHEILHALGFYHEHQRPDRDNFIKVDLTKLTAVMRSSVESQIQIIPADFWAMRSSEEYDFKSIMHYDSRLGETIPDPVLLTKSGAKIDVNKELSPLDIKTLHQLYPCQNKNYTCGQGVIPDYGPVDDKYHCKIQQSCSDGKLSKTYKSFQLAEIYCNRIYSKTCDIIVHLGNDKYEIGSFKNCCNGPCQPVQSPSQSPIKITTPKPTTTTASHCNAGYVSGNMANHVRIGPIHPIQCANTWDNRKTNSVLMKKTYTTLKLASIYCEIKYKGICDTIIEYKKGKSTDDWIYEIGSTKSAACPTGDLGDICIKIHKV